MELSIKTKIKELLNHGIVYGLTSSLQSVLGFILLPILTVYYTPEEFGVFSIILLASALASAFFYFGASSSLARFYFDEDSDLYRKKIVSSALIVTLAGALILIILSLLLGDYLSVLLFESTFYHLHIVLAFSGAAFGFLLNTMTLLLRYEKRSRLFMKITISGVVLNFVITYVLLSQFNFGILAPLYGSLFSLGLSFLYLFTLKLPYLTLNVKTTYLRKILFFGIQFSVSGFLFYLLDYIDRLILKELLPMSDVGIYSLGSRIAIIINVLLILPFSLIWSPMRMEYASNNNNKDFTVKVSSYLAIIGCILILISVLFGEDLMSLVFVNKEFANSAKVFPIIMAALLVFGFQNIVDFGIYLHKKIYFYSIISIIGIVFNVIMNYFFIPYFGYMASAYVTFFTYFLTTVLFYITSSYYHKIKLEWSRIFLPLIVLIVLYYLINFTNMINQFSLLKRIFIFIALIFILSIFWLTKKEKAIIYKFINR